MLAKGNVRALSGLSVLAAVALSTPVNAASFELAGPDTTGYLAFSDVKNAATQEIAESWNFPYYLGSDGVYHSIAAVPLSADSVYVEEALYTVLGKDVTSANFATMSAGSINYDESLLSGVGTEYVAATELTFVFNGEGFSPYYSGYNTGAGFGDFAFNYVITASNVAGQGLTFVNGQLSSVDLTADVAVKAQFAGGLMDAGIYNGGLSITGANYAFDLDVVQNASSPFGVLTNTHMVFNRAGSIAAVSAVPEPSVYAMFLSGLLFMGYAARRRKS